MSRVRNWILASTCLLVGAAACASVTESAKPTLTAEDYAAKGIAATDPHFTGLANLCDLNMRFTDVNVPRGAAAASDDHAHETPAAEGQRARSGSRPSGEGQGRQRASLPPMQIFDNLYFVGNGQVSAFLVGTEADGYILIDALNSNEEAERDILGGMAQLGLDPRKIKYFMISHGHGDHYGGHRLIQEKLGRPVSMSSVDWDLVATLGVHPRFGPAPEKGEVLTDGQVLKLGPTEIEVFVTRAHTPGTISPIITVYDNGVPHKLILWGGTGMNFGPNEERLRSYAASAARMRDLSKARGVDIFMSNHAARDGSAEKMAALRNRKPGDRHPFVLGSAALGVFDVLENCSMAQATRLASGSYSDGN